MVAVSVGLPFRDAEGSLAEAIRSVFAQSFEDWELLLVDDGSSDRSLAIARAVRDARVRVFSDGARRRLPARLNEIVRLARADLVARLDADDAMHPDRLRREVHRLREAPRSDLVGTACFTLDAEGQAHGVVGEAVRARGLDVLRHGLMPHATLLCRRAWCLAHPYDERFPRAEDRELYCRTLDALAWEHLPEPLYFIGQRKDARAARRDYVETSRDNRRIALAHGPRLAGPWAVPPLLVESLAKQAAFVAMSAVGRQDLLLRRRGRPLEEGERRAASEALARVRATAVPGLPPGA